MSFSEKLARVVADQLERFVTLNTHQLAGHVANLDFWIAQARHVVEGIDGYEPRFRRLKAGQDQYVVEHQTETYLLDDAYIRWKADSPQRVAHSSLRDARRAVTDATYRFLVRCCNEQLIPEEQLRDICKSLDISVESTDIRRKH